MSEVSVAAPATLPKRIESLDVLRGLTILVMIFVNDLGGVEGTPAWMEHIQPPDADGMTFVDVVFPAFLFIVGTSIPFAIGRRIEQGEPRWQVWRHIVARTLGLLLIGVFMVNTESLSAARGMLSPALWTLLMYVGVLLVWSAPPRDPGRARTAALVLRAAGAALLVALALLYRGTGAPGLIELRPQWWGILGLIGWAYLAACAVYVLLRRNTTGIAGAIALLYCLYLANAGGGLAHLGWLTRWVDIGSALGSHAAITVSGVLLGMMLTPASPALSPAGRLRWGLSYGAALALGGYLLHAAHALHPMFIINKIAATPAWCLWGSAITVWVWVAVYYVVDVRGWRRWTAAVEPAGQSPLLAYMLAPVLYSAMALLAAVLRIPNFYEQLGASFATGFWRAVAFAFLVTWLAGWLRRRGVQLRL